MQKTALTLESNLDQLPAFCADDERHDAAWQELKHYNTTTPRAFLGIHPIIVQNNEAMRLHVLKQTGPADFLKEYTNTQKNIDRYTSLLNKKHYKDEEQQADWLALIERDKTKLEFMQNLISNA